MHLSVPDKKLQAMSCFFTVGYSMPAGINYQLQVAIVLMINSFSINMGALYEFVSFKT